MIKRYKALLAVLLVTSAFTTTELKCESQLSAQKNGLQSAMNKFLAKREALLAKGSDSTKHGFPVVSEHGKLLFTIATLQGFGVTGNWHAFIITPDNKKVSGPLVDVTSPSTSFTIAVGKPVLFGTYTVVIYNDDSTSQILSSVQKITISNSYNDQVTILQGDTFFAAGAPGESVQAHFVPQFHKK